MLVSKLLSGNARLQQCARDHAAHVTDGDKGPHVKLIQIALTVIDNADIADGEIATSTYGAATRSAVLAYKTRRSIVNLSYQTKPDAIVGIMTIAALDAEIGAREIRNGMSGAARPGADVTTKRD